MAGSPGFRGTVFYKGGSAAGFNNWTLNVNNNSQDVSSFSTSATAWKSMVAGINEFSGTLGGFFDSASTGQNNLITSMLTPTTGTLIVEMDQTVGGKFSGDVVLSGLSAGASIDGTASLSLDFVGNGAATFTTTT